MRLDDLGTSIDPGIQQEPLVIDDEPSLVRALARLLPARRVTWWRRRAMAGTPWLRSRRSPNDVILCDLRMPELDGRAFYAQLQQQAPALCQRVMSLTGDSNAADHQAFFGTVWAAHG